jgi:tRNA pseudouridine13 synthase
LRSSGQAAAVESGELSGEDTLALRRGLEAAGLEQERRALRLRPSELGRRWLDEDVLELSFGLPPGAYATVVLAELGDVTSAAPA